ncbi:hypothetical protein M8J77_015153 [Diaphorina citri]|nr:hypothetical protein M8J77_015153 [Diaphorina citri]
MQILPPIPTSASAYVPTNISDIISSPGALKSSHNLIVLPMLNAHYTLFVILFLRDVYSDMYRSESSV